MVDFSVFVLVCFFAGYGGSCWIVVNLWVALIFCGLWVVVWVMGSLDIKGNFSFVWILVIWNCCCWLQVRAVEIDHGDK